MAAGPMHSPTGWQTSAAELPARPGAYALLIAVRHPTTLPACCAEETLVPGTYVYAGSACGPGGIWARCRRHLVPDKTIRWHIDRLTAGCRPGDVRALAFVGGCECQLAERLMARPDIATPVIGFGNSDCRRCATHLFCIRARASRARIAQALAALRP